MLRSLFLVAVFLLVSFCLPVFSQSVFPSGDVKQWAEQRFAKGVIPPFSFVYDGKKSDSFIRDWQYRKEKISSGKPNEENYLYTYTDKTTGLAVKCKVTCFTDFPAVEWVVYFSNTSGKNTPLIEKVAAVDHSFNAGSNGTFILHHLRGAEHRIIDFEPIDETLQTGKNIYMTPHEGRSSNQDGFPFFNIEMPGGRGMMVAVGWTGKWYADVTQTNAKTVNLKSGMEKMKLTLYPAEEIRTPKICLLFWKGEDRITGHNQFRRFILAHHSPKINGRFAEAPFASAFRIGDDYPNQEYEDATENYCIAAVKRHQQFDIVPEVFWLDAGWYDGCGWNKPHGLWSQNTGNWTACKERFPNGLLPVADAVHNAGAKFLVWFEPERIPDTDYNAIAREHPDWLLRTKNIQEYHPEWYLGTGLYDLGNPEARMYLTDHLTNFIKKEGIDIYRQDFNMDPYPFWTYNDKPDRTGMCEIRHIEGLYAFWDSLLVRFPNLLIDNCASGAMRLDLETMSRSLPLWRTDYVQTTPEPYGLQCHTYGLNLYLPIHGTIFHITSDYNFRSTLSAAMVGVSLRGNGKQTFDSIRKYMQEFKFMRPYYYGDYYPLTSAKGFTGNDVWLAYQLNRPEEKDGVIVAFRRADNKEASIRIKLSGLEKDAMYELIDMDSGTKNRHKGSELMKGFDITLNPMTSAIIKYKIENQKT